MHRMFQTIHMNFNEILASILIKMDFVSLFHLLVHPYSFQLIFFSLFSISIFHLFCICSWLRKALTFYNKLGSLQHYEINLKRLKLIGIIHTKKQKKNVKDNNTEENELNINAKMHIAHSHCFIFCMLYCCERQKEYGF